MQVHPEAAGLPPGGDGWSHPGGYPEPQPVVPGGATGRSDRAEPQHRNYDYEDTRAQPKAKATLVERDEKPVVDWLAAPEASIAVRLRQLFRPAFVTNSRTRDKVPLDRSQCALDAAGKWPTLEMESSEFSSVKEYTLKDTRANDLGAIGGVGMRQYYFVLQALSWLFLACGLASLPALVVYSTGDMYAHPSAQRFADAIGVKLTLGNVHASEADTDAGRVGALWLAALTNAAVCVGGVVFTLWCGKRMNAVEHEIDAGTVTMSDYTVQIFPRKSAKWTAFQVDANHHESTKEARGSELVAEITQALTAGLRPNSTGGSGEPPLVAEIGGKPAVYIGWDEAGMIRLWRKKTELLVDLEAALRKWSLSGGLCDRTPSPEGTQAQRASVSATSTSTAFF